MANWSRRHAPPPQATNWSSRIGIARAAEQTIKELGHKKPGEPLTPAEKVTASAIGASLLLSSLSLNPHLPFRGAFDRRRGDLADAFARNTLGGALGCWNHPLEVIRVEMQSLSSTSPSIATSGIISSTSNGTATLAGAAAATATAAQPSAPPKVQAPTILSTARYIYRENGIRGLFRGVTPRVALGVWRTVCLVSLGDHVKSIVKKDVAASGPD